MMIPAKVFRKRKKKNTNKSGSSLLSMLKPFKCSKAGILSQMWLSRVEISTEYGCIISYFATLIGTFSWDAEAKESTHDAI
jgi:hypothetical protein